jgi:hypothetical protein
MLRPNNFEEFADDHDLYGGCAEHHYAELAWNSAICRMRHLLNSAHNSGIDDWYITLDEELTQLDTGFRGTRYA